MREVKQFRRQCVSIVIVVCVVLYAALQGIRLTIAG